MRLEHSFTVPVPVDVAWKVLLDLPQIAPCMPGATLTGIEGDTFTGTVKVKLGPIALTYQGKGRFVERDEAAHRVVIEASGKDTRSAGTAAATVTGLLTAEGDQTRVDVTTELAVTGKPAQFGRGMISDVSAKLIGQFADRVATTLTGGTPAATSGSPASVPSPAPEKPAAAPEPASAAEPASEPAAEPASTAETALSAVAAEAVEAARTAEAVEAVEAARTADATYATDDVATTSPEAEPIDLLRLTGGTPAARRLAGYGVGAVLVAILAWLFIRRRRR